MIAARYGHDGCVKQLLAAGAHVSTKPRIIFSYVTGHFLDTKHIIRNTIHILHAAGEKLEKETLQEYCPELLLEEEEISSLQDLCFASIRDHLLQVNPVNLFLQVSRLPLPKKMKKALLFNVSLEKD
jgi:hypothetical protein